MAEGAALLVLEELGHALRRGARPLAEVRGYGTTSDAYHMTAPLPSGLQAARAIRLALAEAGLAARQVGYLNAHATATPLGDAAESRAVKLAFGRAAGRVPVSSTKGLHGHALGASGAIEAAITTLALVYGWLPPTVNLDVPDRECSLRHVRPGGQPLERGTALTSSFGFGGLNACLALSRWNERDGLAISA
jgi:3-oxoacyl-[acyl-carrier-protein] synthase II